jgi:hypothetical protein
MTGRAVVVFPAAAKPYPGEAAAGVRPGLVSAEAGRVEDPHRAGAHGCTSLNKARRPCNGNAGPDGKCARHKEN